MARTSQHYVWGAALLCLSACKSEGDAPSTASTDAPATAEACAGAPELGWLKSVAQKPADLEGAGGGWISFYQRNYRDAADKFGSVADDPQAHAGEVRSHIRLGQLYLRLARLVAKTQRDYFTARDALGDEATPLKKAAYYRGVSTLLAGDKAAGLAIFADIAAGKRRAPANYKKMAKAWPSECQSAPKAGPAWKQVANLVICANSLPACPDKVGAAPAKDPWKTRVALYHAALCADPDTVDEARLTQMAGSPADDEALQGKGGISATLDYYDPIALWALGQTHLRKAEKLAAKDVASDRLLKAWAAVARGNVDGAKSALASFDAAKVKNSNFLILSEFQDATKLASWIQSTVDNKADAPPSTLAQMRTAEAADIAGAQCVASPEGKKVVAELGLAPVFARGTLRRSATRLLDEPATCDGALRLLRASQDIKNLESVSYVNEPSFLVGLAEAALCMGRSAEAIGTLRTVKQLYPEAEAALSAAQGLSVVRLMGGTGGTQKIQ